MDNFAGRLKMLIDQFNITAYRLAKDLSCSNATVLNLLSEKSVPGYDFLSKLLNKFPTVNANWLIMGREHMFIDPGQRTTISHNPVSEEVKAQQSIIALLKENMALKDEKIELLTAELREYRAAAKLLEATRTDIAVSNEIKNK
jgi:transcriptional regulator with XRE-family HTH domain